MQHSHEHEVRGPPLFKFIYSIVILTTSSQHGHSHEKEEKKEVPEWKKRAMESGADANAAPFGGSWNTESTTSATK